MNIFEKNHFLFLFFSVLFTGLLVVPKTSSIEGVVLSVSTNIPLRGEPESGIVEYDPVQKGEVDFSTIRARSFVVYDKISGKVLISNNLDEKMAIASITKLMTALIALEELKLNEYYQIHDSDVEKVTPVAGLNPSEHILGQDLVMSMLVGSANDSAKTLGNLLSSEVGMPVIEQMNRKATELEMKNTHFSNPIGFDQEGNYSTARDIMLLTKAALNHGIFEILGKYSSYSFVSLEGGNHKVKATNKLVRNHSDIEAIKTGNTPDALGAMITQTIVNGHGVVVIVLGSTDREGDTLNLISEIGRIFEWKIDMNR